MIIEEDLPITHGEVAVRPIHGSDPVLHCANLHYGKINNPTYPLTPQHESNRDELGEMPQLFQLRRQDTVLACPGISVKTFKKRKLKINMQTSITSSRRRQMLSLQICGQRSSISPFSNTWQAEFSKQFPIPEHEL
jgi:hypothetical protein